MKRKYKNFGMVFTDLLSIILIILCVTVAVTGSRQESANYSYDAEITDLTVGWVGDDGKILSLDALPNGDIVLTHSLAGIDLRRKRLCFRSIDTHVTASFDGVSAYTYAPQLGGILGKSYGMYIQMIPIPVDAEYVTLSLHPIYNDSAAVLRETSVQDAGLFIGDLYHEGLPGFAMCALIALFGVLMLIIGFTTLQSSEGNMLDFFSLGAFAILVGVWSANDTMVLQIFTQHPEYVRLSNYLCLIFVSYLPVSFMATVTNHRKTALLPVMLTLTLVNFALTMTLSVLGIADIREMLRFSHINIGIALIMTIYLMIRAARKKTIARSFLHTVIVGMSAAILGAAADLVRFQVFPELSFPASFFTRVGVMTFLILMGLHLMKERTRIAVEQGQAALMKKMAYTDGLTELANRAAFHLKEDEIRRKCPDFTIIQLDINFLKKVNDVYGHAEGDRHIIGAARIISGSFSGIGTCYRTGGDEFIVVAQDCSEEQVNSALEDMEKAVEAYNETEKPPVPLRIAYGSASCTARTDALEETEKLADQRMYEKKKAMKSGAEQDVR